MNTGNKNNLSWGEQWRERGRDPEWLKSIASHLHHHSRHEADLIGIGVAIEAAGERIKELEQALKDAKQTSFNFETQETPK